jgi:hypothetical protein
VSYRDVVELPLPPEKIFPFFHDLEKWFRLNPQWTVISFENGGAVLEGDQFQLQVEYDRLEKQVSYSGLIDSLQEDESLTVLLEGDPPRHITIEVRSAGEGSFLKYREESETAPSIQEQRELNLWLKSVGNYVLIQHRRTVVSRVWKWFLDRYWLKMSPSGRRTVFFVVAAEGLSLIFFILILIWILIFKKL